MMRYGKKRATKPRWYDKKKGRSGFGAKHDRCMRSYAEFKRAIKAGKPCDAKQIANNAFFDDRCGWPEHVSPQLVKFLREWCSGT